LKNDGRRNGFLATCPLLSVSSPDLLGGNFQNRSCWLAEKPYQALEILCGCSQEELLARRIILRALDDDPHVSVLLKSLGH